MVSPLSLIIAAKASLSYLDARLVERWLPGEARPVIESDRLTWHPTGVSTPMVIDLDAFFIEVLG